MRRLSLFLLACGCADAPFEAPDSGLATCAYPDFSGDMRLDAVLPPYAWPDARRPDGTSLSLSMTEAHCDSHPDLDFAPYDRLLLVSWPEW